MSEPTEPELSVLIVSWNTRDMTLASLRSLYAETGETRFEVILVDNASADGSADAVAAEFPQLRLLRESANHGFAKATNMAAEVARGRYLLLLNSDTLVLDGAVDRLIAFAKRTPEARIWGGRTVFADGRLNPTFCWGRITPWSSFALATGLAALAPRSRWLNPEGLSYRRDRESGPVDVVSGAFFLIDRDLWRELGGFDPAFFMYGEEADLCARARARGARPLVTPEATIVHHGGASEARRTNTHIYLAGARIGLALRHSSPVAGRLARAAIVLAAWWRARLFGLLSSLTKSERALRSAAQWQEIWARRAEWRDGPVGQAL